MNSNSKGFTLLEILVALGIMAVGFLAMSQMQYLSFRQKVLADSGTFSINMIGTISDLEMANAKKINSLNARVYLDSQASIIILNQLEYCDASDDAICNVCPCNPLEAFTSDTFNPLAVGGDTEFTCAAIDPDDFNPEQIEFTTNAGVCEGDAGLAEYYLFRRVTSTFNNTDIPNQINLNITYILKSSRQFADPRNRAIMGSGEINNILIGDSIARQRFQVSAHVERDWTNFVMLGAGNWNQVIVPHIP